MALLALGVVYFNGMGSTRAQGLRYANHIETTKDGKLYYESFESGEKFFDTVWPADDFDDIHVEDVGSGKVYGEPARASVWRRYIGVNDPVGLVYRLVLHKWFPPCSSSQIQKGLDDVRAALTAHERIVIYGNSRGAALALTVLSKLEPEEQERIRSVIAEAPYDTLANVVCDRYHLPDYVRHFLSWLLPYGPLDMDIPSGVPILIGGGTEDDSCPPEGQYRLAKKLGHAELVMVQGANHNNIWLDPAYRNKVKEYIK